MKRTPLKRKPPAPYIKPERVFQNVARLTVKVNMPRIGEEVVILPKENAIYSEPYRRLVAALPCIACGIEGYTQVAHPRPTAKGRKEDDRKTFPLCCVHQGPGGQLVDGCHIQLDQYTAITREDADKVAARYGAETRKTIRESGKWPKDLPHLEEQTELEITA